ncbi:MAG: hypothetical protein AAF773_27995 [Cyanobacteria bacterium P01_D01_bin.115]
MPVAQVSPKAITTPLVVSDEISFLARLWLNAITRNLPAMWLKL